MRNNIMKVAFALPLLCVLCASAVSVFKYFNAIALAEHVMLLQ